MKAAVVRAHGGPEALVFEKDFPDPRPISAQSGKAVAYLGAGGGPVRWNSLFASYEHTLCHFMASYFLVRD
mgnify:CR=1 FL=1